MQHWETHDRVGHCINIDGLVDLSVETIVSVEFRMYLNEKQIHKMADCDS